MTNHPGLIVGVNETGRKAPLARGGYDHFRVRNNPQADGG